MENFSEKDKIEVWVIDSDGRVIITSSGFAADESDTMEDYKAAVASEDESGLWIGHAQYR